jgi:type IX secretion system PorP/SprF family membrane protein
MTQNPLKKILFQICILAISLVCSFCHSQQTPVFSEYNYNPFIINSAYAGLLDTGEITLTNAGLLSVREGSPDNVRLSFHTPLKSDKIGVGAGINRDKIGVTTTTTGFVAYSYKIFFDFKENRPYWEVYQKPSLSFGLMAGIQQFQDNLLELGISNDPAFSKNINATLPIVGFGVLFNKSNFYAGFSTPNILGSRFASDDSVELQSPYYGYFGYRFSSESYENLLLKPSVLLKYENGAPIQADFNLGLSFRNQFEIGAGYRTNSSLNFLAGIYLFESVRLVYNYNAAPKNLTFGNVHGLSLSFRFKRGYSHSN